ncbi:MAG: T9SS type A sorting domain-containing protein [Flavobacteriales bacterium]|nr:T9SS type A sorting domain-containing protein [Flavobacteriales bacterium]
MNANKIQLKFLVLLQVGYLLVMVLGGVQKTGWSWNGVQAQNTTNTGTLYVSSGTTLFTGGDFTTNAGATTEDPGIIELDGNWTNNGTFTSGTGSVIFSGATPQTITKPGVESYYQLTINNTSTGVTLNDDVQVTNALTLTDGIVTSTATNLLTLTSGATSTSGSVASFVHGPMRKIGNQAFVFPIGDSTVWARLGITAPTLATTEYTAQYFDTVHVDQTVIAPLVNVSNIEYWILDQAVNNDDVQITLYWEDSVRSRIDDCSADLGVARYNGTDWVDEGQSAIACGLIGNVSSNVVVNYSPFTLRSKSAAINPLPIELLYFDAVLLDNQTVSVDWTTVSEINNDFFTVERSKNGVDFEALGTVPGPVGGNSNTLLNYNFIDGEPFTGISYYRLKQTDYDGTFTYSPIAIINIDVLNLLQLYPVPALNNITALLFSAEQTQMSIRVYDMLGRAVLDREYAVEEGENKISIDLSSMAAGVYVFRVATQSGLYQVQTEFIIGATK